MNESEITQLQALIARRTGIHFRPADRDKFISAIEARMGELRLRRTEDYLRFLEERSPEAAGDSEWGYLTAHLVPGESYFFRDTGQIALIQDELLPELIAARRKAGDLRLRIWSAGCSTGEEPYSLAALVYDLLPDAENWQVLILGTDPNAEAVERARSGRYTKWSFRQVSAERQSRFFTEESGTYRVLPEIQGMVSFRVHDLHAASYPEPGGQIRDMDLILCRNVFIYLQASVIAGIVAKMERSLIVGGMLVTGHGELSEARPAGLATRIFPASILYQKESDSEKAVSPASSSTPPPIAASMPTPGPTPRPGTVSANPAGAPAQDPKPARSAPSEQPPFGESAGRTFAAGRTENQASSPPPRKSGAVPSEEAESAAGPSSAELPPGASESAAAAGLEQARAAVGAGDYAAAVELLKTHRRQHPADEDGGYLLARAYANLGQHEAAGLLLNQLLKEHPFGVRGYFLLAQISEEQGDPLRSMDLLKRSIYVDSGYIPGYLELGLLYEREGDTARARRMLTSACELLKGLPPGTEIEEYNGQTAEHLIERVEASL
ncbi:MAG: tetratricopeptide repeat protein [bacterium]|nr:tetratricopeptide repeat protein [bacterium]